MLFNFQFYTVVSQEALFPMRLLHRREVRAQRLRKGYLLKKKGRDTGHEKKKADNTILQYQNKTNHYDR